MRKGHVTAAQRQRRQMRVRKKVRGDGARPRLTVHRTLRHMTAQVINDETGVTLASASTQQSDVAEGLKATGNKEAAKKVGKLIAERLLQAGINQVAFDRGRFRYHGRVAALAQAAREAGLKF